MAESDIFVRFGADIDPLKRGTKEATSTLDKFGQQAKKTTGAMAKMAAASAVAGAAIGVKLVKDSLSAIDAQAKLAKQLGTSSASMATLDRAAEMSGISMKQIEAGAKNLEVVMGEAAQGTGAAADTLDRLGLSASSLEGMTLDQKLLTINQALKDNIPATERAAAASDLFGKKAGFAITQLTPETIAESKRQMEGFGLAISDIDAAKIEAANDAMSSIGRAVDGVSQQVTIALAPILEQLALNFQEAAIESGGFQQQATDAVNGVAKAVGFIGNAFTGVELVIDGTILGFKALHAAALGVASTIAESIEGAIQGAVGTINGLIDSVNNIPGVDVSKLVVGQSEMVASITAAAVEANGELQAATQELHNKLMTPLPSEQVEAFIASINNPAIVEAKLAQVDQLNAIDQQAGQQRIAKEEEIQSAMAQIRMHWGSQQTGAVSQMFSDLSTLQQSGNKRMFEIGKAAARANVVMSTYEGAQKAYTALAGIPVVGPALGAAAAGAAIVAGGVRLQAINSTSFGGGGSVSAGAAGASPAVSTPTAAAAPEQTRTVRVDTLDPNALVSGSMVNSIAEQLVELQNDGFKLVV
jgi:hypothetical protein